MIYQKLQASEWWEGGMEGISVSNMKHFSACNNLDKIDKLAKNFSWAKRPPPWTYDIQILAPEAQS